MVRPLGIEYPGAVYHVTSQGDRREAIAKDDTDRMLFLDVLGQALERFDSQLWAYCLMGNHYHLVLRTREANLSRLMRQINGVYTQSFNRRHSLTYVSEKWEMGNLTLIFPQTTSLTGRPSSAAPKTF